MELPISQKISEIFNNIQISSVSHCSYTASFLCFVYSSNVTILDLSEVAFAFVSVCSNIENSSIGTNL